MKLQSSVNKVEKRRKLMQEKKQSYQIDQIYQLKGRLESGLTRAEEKRITERERMQQKLRNHINKVEEVRKEQATKRQASCDNLKSELAHKLESATQKRE